MWYNLRGLREGNGVLHLFLRVPPRAARELGQARPGATTEDRVHKFRPDDGVEGIEKRLLGCTQILEPWRSSAASGRNVFLTQITVLT